MHWAEILMRSCAAIAILAGFWRRSSIVVAAAWVAGEIARNATGETVPEDAYRVFDVIAGGAIFYFRTSRLDALIIVIYVPEWYVYTWEDGADRWWALYWLALAQMILAGPWPQIQRGLSAFSHGPHEKLAF